MPGENPFRRALLYTHRWLGIAGGWLFAVWFATGIVMVYARMPELDPVDRLRRLPELDLSTVAVAPADAARAAGLEQPLDRLRIAMLGTRPVYRFAAGPQSIAVHADTGEALGPLNSGEALRLARGLYPERAATLRHDRRLESPDQWTLLSRASLPLHRVALGDAADTRIYLAERTAEAVMATMRRERRLAYAGAVPHWLYFTALRSRATLWLQGMIWISIAGCVLAASGLAWGILQILPRGGRSRPRSPYSGWMRWHHYAGLVFGLFTFTFVLSGCLSLDPWDWHPDTSPTAEQHDAVAGGPLGLGELTPDRLRAAGDVLAGASAPKELELVQLGGEPFLVGYGDPLDPRLVAVLHPERGAFARFNDDLVLAAARDAMPDAALAEATWLDDYDAYYYDRQRRHPLPVLRARFDDPGRTALYLDPRRGLVLHREVGRTRWNRWLYHGLHSLDFPFLYRRRPLWDVVVIVLCLGGLLLASTSMADGWRRVARRRRV